MTREFEGEFTPKEARLPTLAQAEIAVREIGSMVRRLAEARKGKLPRWEPEVETTRITI